ncbi:MAG TPA: acyltransferase [Rhizomicrobium sp.]|jgi:peptidoglycan/LPS O-acetylase OafA/YrhL|nr:acyltransferase [Rhizomicrobium sp.]
MTETSRPPEIRALKGARALPPLILVLFHYCEGHGYRGAWWFDLPVARGYLWVEFFFALSGFVLTFVYAPRLREMWHLRGYGRFLQSRLARLYPLHLAMLLLILGMVITLRWLAARGGYVSIYDEQWHPIVNTPTFIANLFLVQAWNIFPYLSWNGAAWFVSVEFLLCLLFPLYLAVSRGGWKIATLLIVSGAAGLALLAHPRYGLDLTFHNGIWRGMAAFAMGVGFAVFHRAALARGAARLPDFAFTLAQLTVLGCLIYAIYNTGWSHTRADIYTALAVIALVFVLSFDRGLIAKALATSVPLVLGEWSYAIYIGQTPLLQLLRHAQLHLYPAPGDIVLGRSWAAWAPFWHWLEPALLVTAAIAWGALLFMLIERPANAVLRRLGGGDNKAGLGLTAQGRSAITPPHAIPLEGD